MNRIATIISLLTAIGPLACEGEHSDKPAPVKVSERKYDDVAKADAPVADPARPPAAIAPVRPIDPNAAPDAKAEPPRDLGERFVDPGWFRKALFPEATESKLHRSQADQQGLFSSTLLFQLPEGQTAEACADHLQQKIGAVVTNLEKKQLDDGRFEIKGSTDRYEVTMQCGAPRGQLVAFVSYRWTS